MNLLGTLSGNQPFIMGLLSSVDPEIERHHREQPRPQPRPKKVSKKKTSQRKIPPKLARQLAMEQAEADRAERAEKAASRKKHSHKHRHSHKKHSHETQAHGKHHHSSEREERHHTLLQANHPHSNAREQHPPRGREEVPKVVAKPQGEVGVKVETQTAVVPEISKVALGVSAAFLREFLQDKQIKDGMTTADVCRAVVLPRTLAKKCALHDLITTPFFISPATVFVSHAWKYNFLEVVKVMLAYADECKQLGEPTCYFYFDLFAHSQHSAPDYPQEWWSTTFKTRIGSIGTTLLVLSPWDDPVPLTRSWCLFELLSTVEQKARLMIRLPENQQVAFKNALLKDFNDVMAAMVKIDSERASAFHEKDKTMIAAAIRNACGFTELNALVKAQLRQWLLAAGEKLLSEQKDRTSDIRAIAKFEMSLGALNLQLAKYDDAVALFKSAYTALKPINPSGTATACMNLGLCYGGLNNPKEVVVWMERALEYGKDSHTSAEIANIKIALGNAHIDEGNPKKALPMFQDSLKEHQKSFGERHSKTAFAYNNVGMAYQELHDYKQAELNYAKAMPIYAQTEGAKHPLTASSMHGLAVARLNLGQTAACIQLEEEILKIYTENYGVSHPFTKQTVKTLEVARKKLKNPSTATTAKLNTARSRSRSRGLSDTDEEVGLTRARAASESSDGEGLNRERAASLCSTRGRARSLDREDLTHERAISCARASPEPPAPLNISRQRSNPPELRNLGPAESPKAKPVAPLRGLNRARRTSVSYAHFD